MAGLLPGCAFPSVNVVENFTSKLPSIMDSPQFMNVKVPVHTWTWNRVQKDVQVCVDIQVQVLGPRARVRPISVWHIGHGIVNNYIYRHRYIFTCIHEYIYIYMYICKFVYMYICIFVNM